MKLLMDENIPAQLVRQLRGLGHDVLYAAEREPGLADEQWLDAGRREDRVLITDDKISANSSSAVACSRQASSSCDNIACHSWSDRRGWRAPGREPVANRGAASSSFRIAAFVYDAGERLAASLWQTAGQLRRRFGSPHSCTTDDLPALIRNHQ